ncbi:MAG: UDP-N-acetylmuramate:L-alanyl-gamma-D-glutamyl-meso-diaminopimelate ligase, partial [Deltaproteobacteria bacterium]
MKIHLVGVCGAGMGSLAGLLKEAGNDVSGCDRAFDPPVGPMLKELGIELCPGFDPAHITPELDLAVIGNVCRSSNPEAARAEELGVAMKSFPQTLGEMFLEGRKPIVVAGTHGKTTTTALVGHLLHVCGLDPSYLLGGIVGGSGRSFRLGGGPHFVVEGDEYDSAFFDKRPKFVHYRPWIVLLTSVEYDHADIYPDRESYVEAFRLLVGMVPEGGYLVACRDDTRVVELSAGCRGKVLWYGFDGDANMRVETLAVDETATTAGFVLDGKPLGQVRIPLFGQHNCQNAAGALCAAILSGAEVGRALSALSNFAGVARRMNVLGEARGVIVVDDFAHHPTEVRKTLEAAKARWPVRRIVAVFEPRTNTSRRAV